MAKRGLKERVTNFGFAVLIATFCAIEIILRPIAKDRKKE